MFSPFSVTLCVSVVGVAFFRPTGWKMCAYGSPSTLFGQRMAFILKTSVIHRKGAKSAKDAKKIKDLLEVSEGLVIHPLGELAELHKLLFPL